MTEEEAKTKWCPMVRFTGAGTATDQEWATNRGGDYGAQAFKCIGSECMAWRGYYVMKDTEKVHHGYCGLAGGSGS